MLSFDQRVDVAVQLEQRRHSRSLRVAFSSLPSPFLSSLTPSLLHGSNTHTVSLLSILTE